jgi:hypothetical protein
MAHADNNLRPGKSQQPQRAEPTTWDQPCRCSDEMGDATTARFSQRPSEQVGQSKAVPKFERSDCEMADSNGTRPKARFSGRSVTKNTIACKPNWWITEPNVGRVADGVAARVDRLKAIGNGQVPAVAAAAFALLSQDSKLSQVEHANHSCS